MSKLPSLYEEPPESPRAKEKNKINVVGSLIYEEPATGDFSLNFYTAKFKQEDEQEPRLYQQPLKQSWIVNYPLLAYKCATPDNRDIALVHLSQDIPQRIIHLGLWEFVSFVEGNFKRNDTSIQILFLVKHARTSRVKLVYILADPWKNIDMHKPFNMPETIAVIQGDVGHQPSQVMDPLEFSTDKIRNIQILTRDLGSSAIILGSLLIQFEHCIASTTVRSNVFKLQCERHKMIREYQMRGSNDTVFFGERSLDRSLIYKFEFHQYSSRKLTK